MNSPGVTWTAERRDRLRERWVAGVSIEEIFRELQAMPGVAILNPSGVKQEAKRLRLRRPVKFVPSGRPRRTWELPPPPKVEPSPEVADAAIAARVDLARKMVRARKEPCEIRTAAKLPLREVYRIIGEERRATP